MKVAEIRSTFLDYFAQRGHTIVPSSSLVPANDPTLMFTNSGMVQFKDVFLGTDQRSYKRATSVQACLRAGGKHNDLENVGYTARHHTFFEMLGNWSFGDYFKKEAILWAWELLTQVYKLPAEKLLATVYIDDDEAYNLWHHEIGLPAERIIRIGDKKGGKKYNSDNFWMMADTGPCGPCSEIFYDHGAHIAGGPPGSPDEDGDRFIEIWNIVFMQYDMKADGSLVKLPHPCVDTGMGLERLAAILQNVHSNYEIDLFQSLIQAAGEVTHTADLTSPSLKVIADHIRASAFLVVDGVIPSNEGRGHVLRRIIRRAIRHGYKLGCKDPFFCKLVQPLVKEMGVAYPKLAEQAHRISDILAIEESRFYETLVDGMEILEAELAKSKGVLSGEVAFKLHDTYGFPLDLTADVCRERGLTVDEAGFDAAMEEQRNRGRAASKFKMDAMLEYSGTPTTFEGYEHLTVNDAQVTALYVDGTPVEVLEAGQSGVVVLDKTPFYAESGGQVGDQGIFKNSSGLHFHVEDVQKIHANVFGHHGVLEEGRLKVGDTVMAMVNEITRRMTANNHSATHLMHKALRDILGSHVQQKGSLVDAEKTRFDFSHDFPLTREQIFEIENQVNLQIVENTEVNAEVMPIEQAKDSGAVMLFGEKYGEEVRVLSIGNSKEFCGGTHVHLTGDIGIFKIVSESGVAAGVRRIEAYTGGHAFKYMRQMEKAVLNSSELLRCAPSELEERIQQTLEHVKSAEKEVAQLKSRLATSQGGGLAAQAVDLNGVKVLAAVMQDTDAKALREAMDQLKNKLGRAVIVLASVQGDKVQLAAGVTQDLIQKVKAGDLVNMVATQVGGKGGGRPEMAMAGGTEPEHIEAALQSVEAWVKAKL